MSFDKTTGDCFCERCGYEWKTKPFQSPSSNKTVYIEPRSCAGCKSKVWNQPRTYGGKWLDGNAPMAKRYKPTGRKAANQKPEKLKNEKISRLNNSLASILREYKYLFGDLKKDFRNYDVSYFNYKIFDLLDNYLKLSFELADLAEPNPLEAFYYKRGVIYSIRERLTELLETLEKVEYQELKKGLLDERFKEGDRRARHWHELLTNARNNVNQIEITLNELNAKMPLAKA